MRKIIKSNQPAALAKWRKKVAGTEWFNYDSMKQEFGLREAVVKSLLKEQGGLCAYTGIKVDATTCHIEHVKAQTHCTKGDGEDVDYNNMVACYPKPNTACLFGAVRKASWPTPTEAGEFISPLQTGCERKFHFNYDGTVKARNSEPARQTIEHLGLNEKQLKDYRRQAIRGTLNKHNGQLLDLASAKAALATLEKQKTELDPFIFVVVDALKNHISTIGRKIR